MSEFESKVNDVSAITELTIKDSIPLKEIKVEELNEDEDDDEEEEGADTTIGGGESLIILNQIAY